MIIPFLVFNENVTGVSWLAEVSGLWKILVKIERHTAACSPALFSPKHAMR
jgi:hypothetical protein